MPITIIHFQLSIKLEITNTTNNTAGMDICIYVSDICLIYACKRVHSKGISIGRSKLVLMYIHSISTFAHKTANLRTNYTNLRSVSLYKAMCRNHYALLLGLYFYVCVYIESSTWLWIRRLSKMRNWYDDRFIKPAVTIAIFTAGCRKGFVSMCCNRASVIW